MIAGWMAPMAPPRVDELDVIAAQNAWMKDAACRDLTPKQADYLFFNSEQVPDAAKRMCAACPVREKCLTYSLQRSPDGLLSSPGFGLEYLGYAAGTTNGARRVMIRAAEKAA